MLKDKLPADMKQQRSCSILFCCAHVHGCSSKHRREIKSTPRLLYTDVGPDGFGPNNLGKFWWLFLFHSSTFIFKGVLNPNF